MTDSHPILDCELRIADLTLRIPQSEIRVPQLSSYWLFHL